MFPSPLYESAARHMLSFRFDGAHKRYMITFPNFLANLRRCFSLKRLKGFKMNVKIKIYIKRAVAIILSAALSIGSCGCKKSDGSGGTFKYDISGNPITLDPQTAYDSSSLEIIANMFEGLMKIDSEGNVRCAAAESCEISDDGLVYSFKLREDIYWYDGEDFEKKCTAKDFVFAFQRLVKPATKSKNAAGFFCIKNAKAINSGAISDLNELGVKAEGDYELTITLENPNPSFLVLLTTSPAMPCSEEYYNSTNGQYGLYANTVASNGAFYIYSWNYDPWSTDNNNIIMRRNSKNNSNSDIYPYSLNFFIDEEDSYQNFINEQSHVYITSGSEAIKLLNAKYNYAESSNKVWGILFNSKSEAFAQSDLRRALAYSIQRSEIQTDTVGYAQAEGIIPAAVKLGENSYREIVGKNSLLPYSNLYALNERESALEHIDSSLLSKLTLYIPDDDAIEEYVAYVVQQWQINLDFYCNVERLDSKSYDSVLANGNFDFIVADVSGSFNSPYAYLSSFLSDSGANYANYTDSSFNALMDRAQKAADIDEAAEIYFEAEKMITESGIFIPLLNQSEYAFFAEDCEDIVYNPFSKTVIFKDAKKF